ncbi:MAG TPA: DUF3043 domain-containing protein [Microbacterium sp.]|nr:DUF3043 domain-containing protein [Microbacterium sp.]
MTKTPPPSAPDGDQSAPATVGKGRPTPSRAEREAARRRPLVADTKEAKARSRAEMADKREKARIGMAAGDDRYLTPRDRGPQRRFVRDWTDARWSLSEWIMPLMLVVIIIGFLPSTGWLVTYSFLALWGIIFLVIIEMVLTSVLVKRAAARKFGADRVERGLGWYAAMRQIQMRFLRMPKPQVKRGAKVS